MKKNKVRFKIVNIFVMIAGIVLVLTASSYAAGDLKGPRGETGYARVIGIDESYLATAENRFVVSKDTKVQDDNGETISYSEIKRSSMVKVLYRRVNGDLMALDIILKKSASEKLPE